MNRAKPAKAKQVSSDSDSDSDTAPTPAVTSNTKLPVLSEGTLFLGQKVSLPLIHRMRCMKCVAKVYNHMRKSTHKTQVIAALSLRPQTGQAALQKLPGYSNTVMELSTHVTGEHNSYLVIHTHNIHICQDIIYFS